jgi:DNA-binding MarR family transcriptional regulator
MNSVLGAMLARTGRGRLQEVMQINLLLLRVYLQELELCGYVVRERLFRRGPRLLRLTTAGKVLLRGLEGNMRAAAEQVLE